jgi:hypothetical protein
VKRQKPVETEICMASHAKPLRTQYAELLKLRQVVLKAQSEHEHPQIDRRRLNLNCKPRQFAEAELEPEVCLGSDAVRLERNYSAPSAFGRSAARRWPLDFIEIAALHKAPGMGSKPLA